MDDTLGAAWYELGARDEKLDRDLRAAEGKIKASGGAGAQAYEKQWSDSTGKVKGHLKTVGFSLAALGIGLGLAALTSGLGAAISAASDLAETTSKIEVVFGEASDSVRQMGETSARSLGMSENAALSAAGTFGNLFRSMGIAEGASADMSTGLVKLAADLASFNNMDPTEVLDKLRAGLSGESEPLRALGVNLNAARIEAKALQMGLAGSTGELTAAAKAQATYNLILEDSRLAQGDFARTSDGLANTQRILAAELDNVVAEVGQQLLPIFVELAHFTVDELLPALRGLIAFLTSAVGAIVAGAEAIGSFVDTAHAGLRRLGLAGDDTAKRFGGSWRKTFADMPGAAAAGVDGATGAIEGGTPAFAGAADELAQSLPDAILAAKAEAEAVARQTPGDLAAEIRKGRQEWQDALDQLGEDMETAGTRAARIAALKGALVSEELIRGLRSRDPLVRVQAEHTLALIQQQLSAEGAYSWGAKIARDFASGLLANRGLVANAARQLAWGVAGPLEGHSPPREGPLRFIDRWGESIGRAWAQGVARGASPGMVMGMLGGPQLAMAGASVGGSTSTVNSTSTVKNYHLHVDGRSPMVESGRDAIDMMQRISWLDG